MTVSVLCINYVHFCFYVCLFVRLFVRANRLGDIHEQSLPLSINTKCLQI